VTTARQAQVLRRLVSRPPTVVAAAIVLIFIAIALGAAHLAPFDPTATDFAAIRKPSTSSAPTRSAATCCPVSFGARAPRCWPG